MKPSNHPGHVIPQDTATSDAVLDVITGLPFSQDEIDEFVYGEDRPTEERLDRLRELAGHLRDRKAGEIGDNDAAMLLGEVERAITSLETKMRFVGEPGMLDDDPLDHRETLSPDSDELEEIEEEDEESLEDGETAEETAARKPH